MLLRWHWQLLKTQIKLDYYGFDLFEDATIETDKEDFNVKAHNTMEAVNKRLEEFKAKMKKKQNI